MGTKIFRGASIIFMLFAFFACIFNLPELFFYWSIWFILFSFITINFFREARVGVFILFIIWGYSFAGNIIPQQEFRKKSIKDVKRDAELFIRAGKDIFHGKGMCYLCHSIGPSRKARCPDLLKASQEAGMRKAGYSAKEYFIESLYKPDAYIVQGYSNIMPPVWKPPIGLTALEIETVIAYVQSLSGEKVDITPFVPPVDLAPKEGEKKSVEEVLTGDSTRGKEIFESGKGKCLSCHKVQGKGGKGEDGKGDTIGPDLSEIAKINTINYIKESILSPNMKITTGYAFVDFRTKEDLRVEGKVIKEDSNSIVVLSDEDKVEREFKKSDIEIRELLPPLDFSTPFQGGYFWVKGSLKNGAQFEGELSSDEGESLIVGVKKEKILKNDMASLQGRRIRRYSKMPEYGHVLSVNEFNDLLTYLVTLKGNVSGEKT